MFVARRGCPKEERRGCCGLLRGGRCLAPGSRAPEMLPGRRILSRCHPWCLLWVLDGEHGRSTAKAALQKKRKPTLQLFFSPESFKPVICKDRQLLVRSLLHVRQLPQPQKLCGSLSESPAAFAGAARRFAQQGCTQHPHLWPLREVAGSLRGSSTAKPGCTQPHHGRRPARRPRRGARARGAA